MASRRYGTSRRKARTEIRQSCSGCGQSVSGPVLVLVTEDVIHARTECLGALVEKRKAAFMSIAIPSPAEQGVAVEDAAATVWQALADAGLDKKPPIIWQRHEFFRFILACGEAYRKGLLKQVRFGDEL